MANEGLFLHKTFLLKTMEKKPSMSKTAEGQRFIWEKFLPWRDFGVRNVLVRRAKSQNQLAGLYGPQGTATARPKPGGEQFLATLMDIKAYDYVDPDIVRDDINLAELASLGGLTTDVGKNLSAKVTSYITSAMKGNEEVVDNTIEYLFWGALKNSIVWPPVDDSGETISNPPHYWNPSVTGTWQVGLPADLNQTITSLVDHTGTAATADQKKVWSDASADIIGALEVLNQVAVQKYAFSLDDATIYCRRTLMQHLIKNTAILNLLRGNNNTSARDTITIKQLKQLFIDVTGYTFEFYDSFWTFEDTSKGTDYTPQIVHYLKENEVIIIPKAGINGWMGTVPLENESGTFTPGLMPWLYKDPKPNYRREMGVHAVAWPIFETLEWARLQVLA